MSLKWTADILGWTGAGCLLIAYGLLSMRKLESNSMSYQVLNLFGAGFLMINSLYYGAYPLVSVNGIWLGIGMLSLLYGKK
jgi:hypothetical protein